MGTRGMRRDGKISTVPSSLRQTQENLKDGVRKGPGVIGCSKLREELHFVYSANLY